MNIPKVFISYSWTTPEHEAFVSDLAEQLMASGVDTVFDKWDLKEGQEANSFMEKMVSDDNIDKVIIVSDRKYVEKSNNRSGGAGTEAQIISGEIFKSRDQSKFVALVTELDEYGKAYVPAYYTSRIFIDFTDETRRSESFEKLLRWIFDKPIHKKPPLGQKPSYLSEGENVPVMPTSAAARRALDAVKNGKPHSQEAVADYFDVFCSNLEKFRLPKDYDPLGDEVLDNFAAFVPYRDEVISLVRAIARATNHELFGYEIHRFLESFIPFFDFYGEGTYRSIDFDNYKFFAHELVLHICTTLIAERRVDLFQAVVGRPFYCEALIGRRGRGEFDFSEFNPHLALLEHRNNKLGLRRKSVHADMLRDRCEKIGARFDLLMQTDFILFLRHFNRGRWYPETSLFLARRFTPFEFFIRARSKKELAKLLEFLDRERIADIARIVSDCEQEPTKAPRTDWGPLDVGKLVDVEALGQEP